MNATHRARSIGNKTASGALWSISVSLAGKLVSFGSQIALAWFLLPRDMGLVAMALSIAGIISVISASNLGTLLVQRGDRSATLVSQVFWLGMLMNTLGGLIAAGLCPFTAAIFGDSRVGSVLMVVALASPIMALPTIYHATLQRDLRFAAISKIQFVQGLLQNGCALGLAAAGFGPYSLVIPLPLTAFTFYVLTRRVAGPIALDRPEPKQWSAILSSSIWLMLNSLFNALRIHGATFSIGVVAQNSTMTGLFFWGQSLATQAIFLAATNLQGVFFPALSTLNEEPQRQYLAYRKASLTLGFIAVVISILQILLAPVVIELLFDERWRRAIPVVQWLSLGILTQPFQTLGAALLLARGQFKKVAVLTAVTGVTASVAAGCGAFIGNEMNIAFCVGCTGFLTNILYAWFAHQQYGFGWKGLIRDLAPLICLAILVLAVGWAASHLSLGRGKALDAGILGLSIICVHCILGKVIMPGVVNDIMTRLGSLLRPQRQPA